MNFNFVGLESFLESNSSDTLALFETKGLERLRFKCDRVSSEIESDLQGTVDETGSGVLILVLEKLNLLYLTSLVTGSVLEERSSLKMLGLSIFSNLDWGTVCIAETGYNVIEALICSSLFFSPEVAFYLYESTMQYFMEYSHVWAGAPMLFGYAG